MAHSIDPEAHVPTHYELLASNERASHDRRSASFSTLLLGGVAIALVLAACGDAPAAASLDEPDASSEDAGVTKLDEADASDAFDEADADVRPSACQDDGGTTSCGVGECVNTVPTCVDGELQTCTPKAPIPEVCDNLDNDCDGEIDEDIAVLRCGVGACERTVQTCLPGGITNPDITCTPGTPGPKTCGIDNDCDGAIDETAPMATTFTPVSVTGFNVDAIAETSPASTATSQALDLSDHVLYSVAYALARGTSGGLPDSGTIVAGTRQYRLGAYGQNNALKLKTLESGTLSLVTPASVASVSILGFATEGLAGVDATLEYTDGTTELTHSSFKDWFSGTPSVILGFGRTSRSDTVEASINNPRLYAIDLNLSCASRAKVLQKITFKNISAGTPVAVILAVSAGAP
jgi:Putative metal-binding motif